jgi:enamine deaminase RidA (YjgF/YER057c/UK114 family)
MPERQREKDGVSGTRRVHYGAAPGGFPISRAVRAGDFVITSAFGDHAFRPEDVLYDRDGLVISDGSDVRQRSFADEVRGTIRTVEDALGLAGCMLADVVDVQVWLRDPRDFAEFNRIYAEYFQANHPVRSVFRVDFMFDCRIEIKAVAYKPT